MSTSQEEKIQLSILAFGIARDILGNQSLKIDIDAGSTIGTIKEYLIGHYPLLQKLRSLEFAVNEEYQSDDYVVSQNDEVVIIPPVSGG